MTTAALSSGSLAVQLRTMLLELARTEDECAANDAAAQPYWEACPSSIQGHRVAAAALRDHADRLVPVLARAAHPKGEGR